MAIEMDSRLINMCIDAATQSRDAVEAWRRQRRTLERLPSHLAEALVIRLHSHRLLFPSLLEVFKNTVEKIDLRGESTVDAEWMAYLGAFRYLHSLNVADCHKINSFAIWPLAGMSTLKELDLSRCSKVTDAGIRHLLSIPTLEELCISETGVTANGVTLLSSLKNLSMLDLGGLHITDLVLGSLQVLTKLQYLDIWGSEVSNKGVAVLEMFPKLSFLNLAWTKVTKLPKLSSIACLNMSNCTIHSIFEGWGHNLHLTKLILTGATIADEFEAFSYVDTSFLTFLDLSNSSLHKFCFLPDMIALEYLDLSSSSFGDDSVEMIACVGANLKFLNLSCTKVSSTGLGILARHVPNLETLLLFRTPTDDHAISYISTMPSLKVINLSSTYISGMLPSL